MNALTLDEVKIFLRIDGDDEDALLQSLMAAADSYIENAVGTADQTADLYKVAAQLLITHWYENREPVGIASALAFSLESILLQLRYTAPTSAKTLTVTVAPENGVSNFLTTGYVVWTFGSSIDPKSLLATNFLVFEAVSGKSVPGSLSLSADGTAVTFAPTSGFTAATKYTAVVTTGVSDVTGAVMSDNSVTSFTTA